MLVKDCFLWYTFWKYFSHLRRIKRNRTILSTNRWKWGIHPEKKSLQCRPPFMWMWDWGEWFMNTVIIFSLCRVINGLSITSTSNVLFPLQMDPIMHPKMISILLVIKSINATVFKSDFNSESTSYNLDWNFSTNNRDM